jgi:hypothetical protein
LKPIEIEPGGEMEIKLWEMQQQQQLDKQKLTSIKKIPLLNYVRISRHVNSLFNKNFDQNWTEEVFRVIGIDDKSSPLMYVIEDMNHEVITNKFYKEELQDIGTNPPTEYRIEKILRTKGQGKHKQYLVKWHGYKSSSWIPATNIIKPSKNE